MIWKHYDPRKIQGEKCKPIYKAIIFPALSAINYFFQGPYNCWVLEVKD